MKELADNGAGGKEAVIASTPVPLVVKEPQQRSDVGDTTPETRTIERHDSPLVSVIIPAYNAERFIARTLDSVLSQTYQNMEVIVVNDGSTDRTVEIAESFARKESRIRILHQRNLGLPAARNCGIRAANGEYVATIDADDVWDKEKIQAQVECFQHSSASVGLVYSWSMIIDEDDNPLTGIAHEYSGDVLAELIYSNFVGNGSSPMIRRGCFEEMGSFDVHLRAAEDWDMYLRIAEQYEFQVVPEYHVGYTMSLSSMSANYKNQETYMSSVVDSFEKGHPNIPKSLFRLSRSRTCFYLAERSNYPGLYGASLGFLLRCLLLDPVRIISSEYHLALFKCLVRISAKWIVLLIRRNQPVWGRLHRRLLTRANREPHIWYELGRSDRIQGGSRLYDRIHNWRMARLKDRMATGQPRISES